MSEPKRFFESDHAQTAGISNLAIDLVERRDCGRGVVARCRPNREQTVCMAKHVKFAG